MKQKEYKPIAESMTDENMVELEKKIETQNIEYFELFDNIAKNLSKKEQVDILTSNMQPVPDTKYEVNIIFLTNILPIYTSINWCFFRFCTD